jgi:heme exporter protein A|tara:strand:+ start:114 stop:743 length:630 start_codon:yes stop_codon:yes gene_type:complete
MPIYSINNLESIRQNNILFQGLNITIKDGGLLQINGANGSGKSSLLQICTGLIEPTSGEILWGDKNIKNYRYEFQSNILYLGHTNGIKSTLTIEENMKIMNALAGKKSVIDYSIILEEIGMPNMNEIFAHNISAGQQRRIGLTRLFMSKSKLWFLDEPFNALDKQGKKIVEKIIVKHCNNGGIVFFTTHQKIEIDNYPLQNINLGNNNA